MELISIVDCNLCAALPVDEKRSELPLPETWGRLSPVLARRGWDRPWSQDPAQLAAPLDIDIDQIRVCRNCGTHYVYKQVHDDHFGEPLPPETEWHLRRLTLPDARTHFIHQTGPDGAVEPLDGGWLDQRYETIIGLLRRDLARAPNWQIERHLIDSLYLHFVHGQDWDGLRTTLIEHPDPGVGVYVADRLFYAIDPENVGRPLASTTKYWDDVRAILAAEAARIPFLVGVLADGLAAQGQIMKFFLYPNRWEPVPVAGYAMSTLRKYVPRKSLGAAVPALAAKLQPGATDWWRESARDLLIEYVGDAPKRAKAVLKVVTGDSGEALTVRAQCQRCLGQSEAPGAK